MSYISAKNVRLPRNEKLAYRLISRPQMWPSGLTLTMTLTLNFQGQIWNLLYLRWSDCHKTKSKYIDWTLGLKCDHQIWPWLWPWPWIFKVKYGICYILTKSGPIAMKRKANISIELHASNMTNECILGHDLDIWIFKIKYNLDRLVTKVRCKDLPESDRVTSNVGVPSTHLVREDITRHIEKTPSIISKAMGSKLIKNTRLWLKSKINFVQCDGKL